MLGKVSSLSMAYFSQSFPLGSFNPRVMSLEDLDMLRVVCDLKIELSFG